MQSLFWCNFQSYFPLLSQSMVEYFIVFNQLFSSHPAIEWKRSSSLEIRINLFFSFIAFGWGKIEKEAFVA